MSYGLLVAVALACALRAHGAAAYIIVFDSLDPLLEETTLDVNAQGDVRNHDHKATPLPNGVSLGAVTEVGASAGTGDDQGRNLLRKLDTVARPFRIERTDPDEALSVKVQMIGALVGTLTRSVKGTDATARVQGIASVEGTGLFFNSMLIGISSSGDLFPNDLDLLERAVDVPFVDSASLLVETTYFLSLRLTTQASAIGSADDARSARSDFLDTLTATLYVVPESVAEPPGVALLALGLLGATIRTRRRGR